MYKHAAPINRPPPLPTIIIHLAMYQTQNKTPNAMVNPAQNKKQNNLRIAGPMMTNLAVPFLILIKYLICIL